MNIKPYSQYEEEEILPLYASVGWTNYCNRPDMLEKAFAHSLCILGAYEEDRLVGLIRAVGDGHSILFIQDLLVHPDFQRRGIGSTLMGEMLCRYAHVYQIQLATDNTEKTKAFYRSQGFHPLEELGCRGFMKT
ncbi:MAG: GNAT family N-acetyltransferase [Oscillospiraceae bacterium]|nr:GNAT family N-acetyltransferase [Oscillospiraceae bacterium]